MSYPIIPCCFSCGNTLPMAIIKPYYDLKQKELNESDLTSHGLVPKEDSPSMKLLEEADITLQCCRRMIFGSINTQIDITQDPLPSHDSPEPGLK